VCISFAAPAWNLARRCEIEGRQQPAGRLFNAAAALFEQHASRDQRSMSVFAHLNAVACQLEHAESASTEEQQSVSASCIASIRRIMSFIQAHPLSPQVLAALDATEKGAMDATYVLALKARLIGQDNEEALISLTKVRPSSS
jgi:hypothetical protein